MPATAEGQSWKTVALSRRQSDETSLHVSVAYGAGHLRIRPGERGLLYGMQLRYDEDSARPVSEYDREGKLRLGIEGVGGVRALGVGRDGGELSVQLGRGLPIDLTVEFGAGRADLDLGGLSLSELTVKTGASEVRLDVSRPNPARLGRTEFQVGAADFEGSRLGNLNAEQIEVSAGVGSVRMDFSGDWSRDADVSVSLGMGSLELRFPEGLGVRVRQTSFLTSFDAAGLVERDGQYYSPDWDQTEHKVSIEIDAKFGSVSVDWIARAP